MNKKVFVNDVQGGPGIYVMKNENTSNVYNNGEYIDIVNSITNVAVDPSFIQTMIDQQISMSGTTINNGIRRIFNEQILELLRKQIHFEIVHWTDEENRPMFTCQVLFDKQVLAEKDITPDGNI